MSGGGGPTASSSGGGGGSSLSTTQQQPPSRLQEALAGIPLWVTVVTAICIILQAAAMLLNWDENELSISAGPVIYSHEVRLKEGKRDSMYYIYQDQD